MTGYYLQFVGWTTLIVVTLIGIGIVGYMWYQSREKA